MNGFTKLKEKNSASQTFIELISKIDKKGRALISADLRRQLRLKYGSKIIVKAGDSVFETKVDERGRFSVPAKIRNGCDSVKVSIGACGAGVPAFPYNPMQPMQKAPGAGSNDFLFSKRKEPQLRKESRIPARGPILKNNAPENKREVIKNEF